MARWTERRLRDYIWRNRARWDQLLLDVPDIDADYPPPGNPLNLAPEELIQHLLNRRSMELRARLGHASIFGREVRLDGARRKRMFIDLLGNFFELGVPGLVVLELKVSAKTARESFTELLGYGQALGTVFPGMSRDDVVAVLVAPMERVQAVVRMAAASMLAFDSRPLAVFEPVFDHPRSGQMRLRSWVPESRELALLGRAAFRARNFAVVQVCWSDDGWWGRLQLNGVAHRAAIRMESAGIHGFVFASQAVEGAPIPLRNTLTCVGLNPYDVARDVLLRDVGEAVNESVVVTGMRLSHLLPNVSAREAGDDLDAASSAWASHMSDIAWDVVARSTRTPTEREGATIEPGGPETLADYQALRRSHFEDDLDVMPTGLLRRLYEELVDADYSYMVARGPDKHPLHGDPFRYAEEMLRSRHNFWEFLRRMQSPGGSFGDMARDLMESLRGRRQT